MQKLIVFILSLLFPFVLWAQKKGSKIQIVSYAKIQGDIKKQVNYLRNPIFRQDNATLTCDSAVFYSERNYFEAYRNVHINQLTTDIYSDQLQYDGNTKKAHLTDNVRMVDPQSVLTTNILDYNTATKIGTYTTGGKIVNKDVTLTSKNGYYFSESSDSYFRYDVVVVTPQVNITSDTLRYNTKTKWTYFYGPTNIKGKDDNLYTENGAYNTGTEDAYFGQKNLYTQGTRTLKGDSLYYYGKKGIGKAVKNIVFSDTKDKMKMFGDLGFYYKVDQRTLVTRKAYVGIGTEDSIEVKGKKRPDSLWLGADTLETQMVLQKTLKLIPKISVKADNEVGADEEGEGKTKEAKFKPGETEPLDEKEGKEKKDTSKNKAARKLKNKKGISLEDLLKNKGLDSLAAKNGNGIAAISDSLKNNPELKKKADSLLKTLTKNQLDSFKKVAQSQANALLKNPNAANTDSLKQNLAKKTESMLKDMPKGKADSLKQNLSSKAGQALKQIPKGDSLKQNLGNQAKNLIKSVPKSNTDSLKKQVGQKAESLLDGLSKGKADTAKNKNIKTLLTDSAAQKINNLSNDTTVFNPADTVKARIIKAYHGVKIYKTNIQAKTDSLFYTSADSTLRFYFNPIVWSEGSQQVGDTILLQFRNKKLNNLQAYKNAFLVNTPADSLRFNQIKGRQMTGFFAKGRMKTLYVDGNAESIYYTQDDSTKVYKEMNQTLSSRIKFIFKDKENDIDNIVYIKGIEGALNPENMVAKDLTLKGFSWKPKERPLSKKDAIGAAGGKKKTKAPPAIKKNINTKGKPIDKVTNQIKAAIPGVIKATDSLGLNKKQIKDQLKGIADTAKTKLPVLIPKKTTGKDSVLIDKKLPIKNAKDSTNFGIKPILPKKDTTQVKKQPATKS